MGAAYIQGAGMVLQGLGSLSGPDQERMARQDRLFQAEQQRSAFQFQAGQSDLERELQSLFYNAKARGQGDINKGLMALMEEFRNTSAAGVMTPEEQSRQVGLQTQALQPRLEGLAGKIASQFGLNSPAAQVALGKEAVAGEQRVRADVAATASRQKYEAEQRTRQLIASLQQAMGSTREVTAPKATGVVAGNVAPSREERLKAMIQSMREQGHNARADWAEHMFFGG